MTNFKIKIAGRIIAVSAIYGTSRDYCREYLCKGEADFAVAISPEDIAYEREMSRRTLFREGGELAEYPDAYLETIAIQRKIAEGLFNHGVLLFHGSVVAVDGEGYLFTAKSGTGKSTHARLWREMLGDRAVMVNDDKPFLSFVGRGGVGTPPVADRAGGRSLRYGGSKPPPYDGVAACRGDSGIAHGVLVHGSPWNGKHRLGSNLSVPLKAICILERGAENEIRPIPAREALFMLLQQSSRPQDPALMPAYMDMIDALSGSVSFYRLSCNTEPEAARVAYEAMR